MALTYTPPEYTAPPPDMSYFEDARKAFGEAASTAQPSQASMETAAARIRSRIEGKQRADQDQALNMYGASGGNAGGYEKNLRQIREGATQGYATGLADLQSDFWKKQQEGASILSNVGQGYTGLGTGAQQATTESEKLKLDAQRMQSDAAAKNAIATQQMLNSLGQYGGTLGLIQSANPDNAALAKMFEELGLAGLKLPDAKAFTDLAKATDTTTPATPTPPPIQQAPSGPPPPPPTAETMHPPTKNELKSLQEQYKDVPKNIFSRLQVVAGQRFLYDPVQGAYVVPQGFVLPAGTMNSIPYTTINGVRYQTGGQIVPVR